MKACQIDLLYDLLSDQKPHRTDEILKKVYGSGKLGIARIGARIYDIKQRYSVEIIGWHDKLRPTLYWYMMKQTKFYEKQSSSTSRKVTKKKRTNDKRTGKKVRSNTLGKRKT